MPGIGEAILGIINGVLNLVNGVFNAKNTPEMKKAKKHQKETDHQNEIEKAIKEKDLEKLRRLLSE
jgi:hypothetical protein